MADDDAAELSQDELSQWNTTEAASPDKPSISETDVSPPGGRDEAAAVSLDFQNSLSDRANSAPPHGSSLETVLQWRERQGRDGHASRRSGAATADPKGPGRRSWLDQTPLSTKPNPPGTKWGTAHRAGAKFRERYDERGGVSGNGLGWRQVDQWNALRHRAASPFITSSQRTSGFAADLNKTASESPGSAAYNLQYSSPNADSRRASTPWYSFSKGHRNDMLLARNRKGRVSATYGTPDNSGEVGTMYSSLDKQVLATKPSYRGVMFSQARRKGPGERNDIPGPGEYEVKLKVGDRKDHLLRTKMPQMPVHEFPRQKRPWQRDKDYKKDKPFGEMRIRYARDGQPLAKHRSAPAIAFSRAPRHGVKAMALTDGSATGPGPGAYFV